MTDITPEQRAAFMEKASATQTAARAHMRFVVVVALIQVVLLAVIALGVWLR